MELEEFKNKIRDFYNQIKKYRDLLSVSHDEMVRIIQNHKEIAEQKSFLNIQYGSLSKYIKKIGNYPMGSDVGGGPYPVYENALSDGVLQRRGPCIDVVIQDLEFILGKLSDMSEEKFKELFLDKEKRTEGVELYARNLKNNGKSTSDSRTKVVSENYSGYGEISSYNKKDKKQRYKKWWIEFLVTPLIVGLILLVVSMFLF